MTVPGSGSGSSSIRVSTGSLFSRVIVAGCGCGASGTDYNTDATAIIKTLYVTWVVELKQEAAPAMEMIKKVMQAFLDEEMLACTVKEVILVAVAVEVMETIPAVQAVVEVLAGFTLSQASETGN